MKDISELQIAKALSPKFKTNLNVTALVRQNTKKS